MIRTALGRLLRRGDSIDSDPLGPQQCESAPDENPPDGPPVEIDELDVTVIHHPSGKAEVRFDPEDWEAHILRASWIRADENDVENLESVR